MNKPASVCPFRSIVEGYIQHWRALGRSYNHEAWLLSRLCTFMEASNARDLDQRCFEAWCRSGEHLTPTVRRRAQLVVRKLCLYRQRTEPDCFVPNPIYFTRQAPYHPPVIIGPDEIARLLDAIARLPEHPVFPLRKAVMRLAVVLLYTTGLRRRELVRLTLADVNLEQGTLAIRESKFHKTRFVPLSRDAKAEIRAYLRLRLAPGPDHSPASALLGHYTLSGKFTGYRGGALGRLLTSMLQTAQICDPQGRRPRVHDFRHSFAVQALLRWYRDGADVQAQLPKLAMYMGHVSIVSTAHYLHWIPDVATVANRRFEAQWGKLMPGEPS
jgi:integrase/recombinase XerD